MPGKYLITKIEPQKNNPERCSVYLDGKFAFGIHRLLLSDLRLKENRELTAHEVKEIARSIDKSKIKEQAFRLLSVRPRSEKELKDKLRQKKASPGLIEKLIEEFREKQLLDDRKFAQSWAQSRISNKPMGKFLLRQELLKKGIKKDIIDQTVSSAFDEVEELELARTLLRKKSRRFANDADPKIKKRMADFLLRRGFSYAVVSQAIRGMRELSEEI